MAKQNFFRKFIELTDMQKEYLLSFDQGLKLKSIKNKSTASGSESLDSSADRTAAIEDSDKTQTHYGIVARNTGPTGNFEGFRSALCGRLIRQAFRTGIEMTDSNPTP